MTLAVIFVNYRSSELILDALGSLYVQSPDIALEVWVVDNASGDDSRKKILGAFPTVHWIDMGYNAGFARANNAGILAAGSLDVLLLNPDTIILDGAVEKAYTHLVAGPYAACGVQLLNPDGSPQISGNYFMRGGLNHLLPIPYLGDFLRWLGHRTRIRVPNVLQADTVTQVDWISGAFLMVKRSAIEQAGLMDEDFFLYGEEVEWCSRLIRFGPLVIFGREHIIHLQGETIQQKGYKGLFTRKDFQLMLSNHLRVRKQFGPGWFLLLLMNYSLGAVLYLLASPFHGHWRDAFGFFGNVRRLWGYTPRILRGAPHFYKVM
jgi:GT2 family glycosyltransferase